MRKGAQGQDKSTNRDGKVAIPADTRRVRQARAGGWERNGKRRSWRRRGGQLWDPESLPHRKWGPIEQGWKAEGCVDTITFVVLDDRFGHLLCGMGWQLGTSRW